MADKAYSSHEHQTFLRERRITAAIGERAEQKGHRLRRAAARARPISDDRERYNDRNSVERCYERLKQWRGLATRYDKLVVIYRGGAVLRSIILWAPQSYRGHAPGLRLAASYTCGPPLSKQA